jgi:hypothetical protein
MMIQYVLSYGEMKNMEIKKTARVRERFLNEYILLTRTGVFLVKQYNSCSCCKVNRGALDWTRTSTSCEIRPSNVRVYQFHHQG